MEIVLVAPRKYKDICMQRVERHMNNCLPKQPTVPLEVGIDFGTTYSEAK